MLSTVRHVAIHSVVASLAPRAACLELPLVMLLLLVSLSLLVSSDPRNIEMVLQCNVR